MASIRTYCKHDITLVQKLLLMFHYLIRQESEKSEYIKTIKKEAETLLQDVETAISNDVDIKKAKDMAKSLNLYLQ